MKQVLVIVISLIVFLVPNLVGLTTWYFGANLPTVLRSLTAILAWVVSFGLSALLFWRVVTVTLGNRLLR